MGERGQPGYHPHLGLPFPKIPALPQNRAPKMSFTPFDPSAPSHTTPPARPVYDQSVYGAYEQPVYGNMGYSDMPQSSQRYNPSMQNMQGYSASSAVPGSSPYHGQQDVYTGPSFSPTSSHFAPQPQDQYIAESNPNAMTYTASRRRYQSTSGALPSDGRYPMPRPPSAETHMPMVNEGYDFVPSQAPLQLGYPSEEGDSPTLRHTPIRSSSTGHSLTTSALALEKPYECDICHTRFARHHDCRRHRETHAVNASGEKPHHCVVCGKSFTRKDALKRHSNQKGCDISMASAGLGSSRSSHSSSSTSPQQSAGAFYPIAPLPHGSTSSSQHY